jgi:hypothetical protein
VRTLAWRSVLLKNVEKPTLFRNADGHTSDIGHWFAMTENRLCRQLEAAPQGAAFYAPGGRFCRNYLKKMNYRTIIEKILL